MLKLMKYEFRKTMFSKYVLLIMAAILECVFLAGIFLDKDSLFFWGVTGLAICAMVGLFYIGIESLIVFERDLNTKQSYMLFLTPHNSYEILGAKVLENGLAILLTGVFFALLAAADIAIALVHLGGFKELLDFIQTISTQFHVEITITKADAFLSFMAVLFSWLSFIINGNLAIVLSATIFAGKKISGFMSFVAYIVLGILETRLLSLLPEMQTLSGQMGMMIGTNLVIVVALYLVTGWIMDHKLSV